MHKNIKLLIILIIVFIIVLLAVLAFSFTQVRIVKIFPEPNSVEIDPNTKIEITFSGAINPKEFKAGFTPQIDFSLDFSNKNTQVILKPKYPLTEGQTYLINLQNPVNFKAYFTIKKLPLEKQEGQVYGYSEGVKKALEKEKKESAFWDAIIALNKILPITKSSFSMRYVSISNTYIVALTDSDKQKAKNDFLIWLKDQKVDPTKITILYTDTINFTIATTSVSDKPMSIVDGIKITFSDPIKAENGIKIKLDPDTKVLQNFNKTLTELTIVPQDSWNLGGSYQLTILSDTQSKDGQKLGKDFKYSFKISSYQGL